MCILEPSLSNVTAASHHGALATTSTAVAVNSILVNSDQQRSSISDVKSNKMITIRNLNASSGIIRIVNVRNTV